MISDTQRLIHALENNGLANAADAVHASALERVSLAVCCAMLENESGGRNIFGADPGGDALPRQWYDQPVTREHYLLYKERRDQGMIPNGVGPCQLTSAGLQDAADRRGGCWIPLHNMTEGFSFLGSLIREHGEQGGFAAYNGSGPAADAYGARAVERARAWQNIIDKTLA